MSHELMDGYEALVLGDAVDRGGAPGALYVLEPEVPDVMAMPALERRELTADIIRPCRAQRSSWRAQ